MNARILRGPTDMPVNFVENLHVFFVAAYIAGSCQAAFFVIWARTQKEKQPFSCDKWLLSYVL